MNKLQIVFAGRDHVTQRLGDQNGRKGSQVEEVVPVGVLEDVRMRDDSLPEGHNSFLEFGQMRKTLSNKIRRRVEKS